ncbi:MAG: L,D-transpeptidase family protein [Ginsengibacter sp.]
MIPSICKYFIFCFIILFAAVTVNAQNSFWQSQRSAVRVNNAFFNKEELLQKEFAEKGLQYPAKYVYLRSFKHNSELEIWVRNSPREKYKLFKTYRVCMQSGTMGPKRLQGDYQVPEGFYYINEFNPRSNYHLSLGINYPNASDRILSDPNRPGNGIYIHGSCVSVGCVSVNDSDIEEVYLITGNARAAGQEFIPVHIFPIRYNDKKSVEYLDNTYRFSPTLQKFSLDLRKAYDEFEKTHQLPVIMIDKKGEYVIN